MRITCLIILGLLLASCTSTAHSDFPPQGSLAQGIVREIFRSDNQVTAFLVEQDQTKPQGKYERILAGVTQDTHVYQQQGTQYSLINIAEIHIGSTIAVYINGPIAISNPPSGHTHLIILIER